MKIETFEVLEVDSDGNQECPAEAIALIEKLDLEGQRTLLHPSNPSERPPYRKMTADEKFVYKQLCPCATKLEKYGDEPIPLRVLQIAAHAKSLDRFTSLEIWHPDNADVKDPVLVGRIGESDYSSDTQFFILARWGEVLESYAKLKAQALRLRREMLTAKYSAIAAEAQTKAASVKAASDMQIFEATDPYLSSRL